MIFDDFGVVLELKKEPKITKKHSENEVKKTKNYDQRKRTQTEPKVENIEKTSVFTWLYWLSA